MVLININVLKENIFFRNIFPNKFVNFINIIYKSHIIDFFIYKSSFNEKFNIGQEIKNVSKNNLEVILVIL